MLQITHRWRLNSPCGWPTFAPWPTVAAEGGVAEAVPQVKPHLCCDIPVTGSCLISFQSSKPSLLRIFPIHRLQIIYMRVFAFGSLPSQTYHCDWYKVYLPKLGYNPIQESLTIGNGCKMIRWDHSRRWPESSSLGFLFWHKV